MQITELKNDDLAFEAKIIIPIIKIDEEVQKELTVLSKRVKIDGFRVGKIPSKVIEKKYKPSVKLDVVQDEVSNAIKHVITEYNLKVLGKPKLEDFQNKENEDLEFILKFELVPSINLPDFKQITITRPKLIIEEEINKQIDRLAEEAKSYTIENIEKAEKGHQLTVDMVRYVDGEIFEGGKVTDYKLVLGRKTLIDNFEDQLIGVKIGEEREVNVTFPAEYHLQKLAGKPSKCIVQVKAIRAAEEVIIDDEFAKKFGCDTLEILHNNISQEIEEKLHRSVITVMKMSLFDQLEKILTFNVPQSLVTQEINILKSQTNSSNEASSMFKDKTEAEINEYYNKLALRRVRIGLVLAEYMSVKKLRLLAEDIENAVMALARGFPSQELVILDFYKKNPKALESLRGAILEEKAVQDIFDNEVTIAEKEYTTRELEEFLSEQEEKI
ncbi:Trigger factor [Pseudolycoriella hygida]|uniref:peptidylprolyl isomerase n=1 Tax=Pseudolycoriella hygida TaxID=35572 RepID=A0A9Q0N776_9DIPT|nr:Trigger factor [Pseudolycoriella hygida]